MALGLSKLLTSTAGALDRRFGWDKLPRPLGVLTLVGLRTRLREKNLYDTGVGGAKAARRAAGRTATRDVRRQLQRPRAAGDGHDRRPLRPQRPGRRHVSRSSCRELLEPNPRLVSRELLTRDEFKPATIVNVLAGAWLQFEVHDWFSHGKNDPEEPFELDARPTTTPGPTGRCGSSAPAAIPTPDANGGPPTYVTADSHWWDGSQIYGSDPAFSEALRSKEGGKLRLDPDGQLPRDLEAGVDLTGVAGNFWLGLALLHTLFTREHNAICDRLQGRVPALVGRRALRQGAADQRRADGEDPHRRVDAGDHRPPDDQVRDARQLVRDPRQAAGQALGRIERGARRHPRLADGPPRRALLADRGVRRRLPDAPAAPRRLHVPVDRDGRGAAGADVPGARRARTPAPGWTRSASSNSFYSLGIAHPGAITLHNYPRFLQEFKRPDGTVVDLAAIDILRIRERGVPRYNEFRRLFHLKPAATFEELTDNPEWAKELRRVYGDVERVDLMVGLYAEPLPKGFGFSDTAFRVFILMASRRLKSDRFFTSDYNAETYTQAGLDWIDDTTMIDVLQRHYPELEPALRGVDNAFAPWTRTGGDAAAG